MAKSPANTKTQNTINHKNHPSNTLTSYYNYSSIIKGSAKNNTHDVFFSSISLYLKRERG
jgi:hypothetical protein